MAGRVIVFFSGVLIDADHLVEYIKHYGLKTLNFKAIYRTCKNMPNQIKTGGVKKLYLFLHAAELAILLWISFAFTANLYLLSIALGYTVHLIMDASANTLRPSAYFIASRIKNNFSAIKLMRN